MSDDDIEDKKNLFLANEFMMLAWSAAVQQRGAGKTLWKEGTKSQTKKDLRKKICAKVLEIMKGYKEKLVDSKTHIKNIGDLKEFIEKNEEIKKATEKDSLILTFATAQKLLNTALKYWWCVGWIKEPPHFPLDGINLSKVKNDSLPKKPWTSFNEEDYDTSIKIFKEQKGNSLATWELDVWQRRSNIIEDVNEIKFFTQST